MKLVSTPARVCKTPSFSSGWLPQGRHKARDKQADMTWDRCRLDARLKTTFSRKGIKPVQGCHHTPLNQHPVCGLWEAKCLLLRGVFGVFESKPVSSLSTGRLMPWRAMLPAHQGNGDGCRPPESWTPSGQDNTRLLFTAG